MAEQSSIGIIGTGWVRSSVAISTLHVGAVLEPHLDQVEIDGLERSGDVLSEAIETVSGA